LPFREDRYPEPAFAATVLYCISNQVVHGSCQRDRVRPHWRKIA
jgi:hypothetical protein